MKDNKNKIIIIVLSVLFVLTTVTSIVLFVKYKETNEVLAITEQEVKSNAVNVAATNAEVTKVENTTTEKIVEKNVEVAKIINFDRSKTRKVREGVVYGNITDATGIPGFTVQINTNGEVIVGVPTNDLKNPVTEKKVEGLQAKAVDFLIGSVGDGSAAYLMILMDNGKVVYLDEAALNSATVIKANAELLGLNNIVKILCCKTSSTTARNTGWSFIAIDKEGYFNDISLIN